MSSSDRFRDLNQKAKLAKGVGWEAETEHCNIDEDAATLVKDVELEHCMKFY